MYIAQIIDGKVNLFEGDADTPQGVFALTEAGGREMAAATAGRTVALGSSFDFPEDAGVTFDQLASWMNGFWQ